MIPWRYIKVLADCYIFATNSSEFWKLSDVIEKLMDYDSNIKNDNVVDAEFKEIRICMMKHFKYKEDSKECQ